MADGARPAIRASSPIGMLDMVTLLALDKLLLT
jgi:hypothetical protein